MDLNSRGVLREIREKAYALSQVKGTNLHWVRAYNDLMDAADKLDAMNGRSEETILPGDVE